MKTKCVNAADNAGGVTSLEKRKSSKILANSSKKVNSKSPIQTPNKLKKTLKPRQNPWRTLPYTIYSPMPEIKMKFIA